MNNGANQTSLQEDVNISDVLSVSLDEQTLLETANFYQLTDSDNCSNDEVSATNTSETEDSIIKNSGSSSSGDENDSSSISCMSTNNNAVVDKTQIVLHNIVEDIASSLANASSTATTLLQQNDERKVHFQPIMANTKRIRQVHERANSLGKMYQSSRRVSFAENDCDLVTGYLEPANPWASVKPVASVSELAELYKESCEKHKSKPIESIIKHLDTLDLSTKTRRPKLDLRAHTLTAESCEPLEELLKRIQYKLIDLTDCGLDDVSATALFDMIEYYEATNEIDISENSKIANRGWQACFNMIKRSHALQMLATRCTPLSESNATNLAKAMLGSSLHTLKLEHCGLTGRPIASLCIYLRRNTVLKELSLAHNDLTSSDAFTIGIVLKSNFYLQFLDVSNNRIEDLGVLLITEALMEQSKHFRIQQELANLTPASTSTTTITDKTNDSITSIESSAADDKLSTPSLNKPPSGNGNNGGGRSILETLLQNQKQSELQQQQQQKQQQHIEVDIVTEQIDNQIDCTTPPNNNNELLNVNPITARPATPGPTKNSPTTEAEIELKIVEDMDLDRSSEDLISFEGILDVPLVLLPNAANVDAVPADNNNSSLTDVFFHHHRPSAQQSLASNTVIEEQLIDVSIGDESVPSNNKDLDDAGQTFDINKNDSIIKLDSSLEISQSDLIVYSESDITINSTSTANEINILPPADSSSSNRSDNAKQKNDLDDQTKRKVQIENSQCEQVKEDDTPTAMTDIATTPATQTPVTETPSTLSNIVIEKPTEILPHIPLSSSFTSVSSASPNKLLHCTPPTLRKSADNILLTPDSSQSLDSSSLCELSVSFEQPTSIAAKVFQSTPSSAVYVSAPERSFSSESLNSETSIDSNDSKSSIRLTEAKFSRNGTLERQQHNAQPVDIVTGSSAPAPSGLQVLIMWNNRITRSAAQSISDLLAVTKTLEILNIGRNVLSNDFLENIKLNLKANTSLTNLGLQGAHLTCTGIQTLADVLEFGGNSTLQRIDLRDNNLQVSGLMALNDVLKSNKSVTRIDLDDVPRRGDTSSDSSIDYSRMVNNIRAQCARNENPPEPEAVRTTSIRRLRNTYLNSRKISLTCHTTIRTSPSSSAVEQQSKVTERNLLDPNRKSSGRLRSPLPSPIPSPVSSPVPSPSRSSRFQVSRVVETSTSPITPPPSNSCSPTIFPASLPTSRFHVTSVTDLSVPLSSVTKMTKPKSVPANMNNCMTNITKTNSVTSKTTTQTNTKTTPVTKPLTSNTKEESQPIKISSISTTATIDKGTQIVDTPITISTASCTNVIAAPTVSPPTLTPPASASCKSPSDQLATAVSHSISTSFDSPDLEVKRYMDDSCSSISSIDSIDRHRDFNTSNSSIDSVDSLLSETIKSPFSSLDGNVSGVGGGKSNKLSHTATGQIRLPLSIIETCSSSIGSSKLHDSLSSLETSTCSNESLNDSQDLSLAVQLPVVSSNEGTLTNSPSSACYCKSDKSLSTLEMVTSAPSSLLTITDDKEHSSGSSTGSGTTMKPATQEKRVRKTSWISNPMSMTKSDGGYPATLDKLLSLFQHPGSFFTRSADTTSSGSGKKDASCGTTASGNQENKPPSRKESPMGGLFAWTTGCNRKDVADDQADQVPQPTAAGKTIKSPLQTNISPENTVTAVTGVTQPSITIADMMPVKLKQEMKENISPEHTITAATVMNVKSRPNVVPLLSTPPHEKVVFELGGGDEDDDIQLQHLSAQEQLQPFSTTTTTTTVAAVDVSTSGNNKILGSSSHTGIGQIARDSLSILKGSSTNSQDSMRSLESLSEIEASFASTTTKQSQPSTTLQ